MDETEFRTEIHRNPAPVEQPAADWADSQIPSETPRPKPSSGTRLPRAHRGPTREFRQRRSAIATIPEYEGHNRKSGQSSGKEKTPEREEFGAIRSFGRRKSPEDSWQRTEPHPVRCSIRGYSAM